MPKDMSIKPEPYQHHWSPTARYEEIYTGWAYPPKDYGKWAELVNAWVRHCIERYGKEEVQKGYWEVWNEGTLDIGAGRRPSFRNSSITRPMRCGGRCRRRKWAGRKRREAAGNLRGIFWSIACGGRIMRRGKRGHRWILFRFMRRGRRSLLRGTCRWGSQHKRHD